MSKATSARNRAVVLAVSTVGFGLVALGPGSAYADLAGGYYSNAIPPNGGNSWFGTPAYTSMSAPVDVDTAQGIPTLSSGAMDACLAETITPSVSFTLGRLDIIASGGGGAICTLQIIPLNSSSPASESGNPSGFSSSGGDYYVPVINTLGSELLGNGNGETFHFYGFGDTEDVAFNLTNGPNADDQVTLDAGTTYAIEIDEPTSQLYWWRYSAGNGESDPNGGQAYSGVNANPDDSRQTLAANGESPIARTFSIALYQPYDWNIPTGGGDWNTGSNWLNGIVPTGVGMEADLTNTLTAPSEITSTLPISLGILNFSSSNEYTVGQGAGGGGSLLLSAVSGTSAMVNVSQGNAEIDLPTSLASNATINVAAGSTLTFGSPILLGSQTFVHSGGGTTVLAGITDGAGGANGIGQVSVTSGVLRLAPGSGASSVGAITTSGSGILDITNNALFVNYALAQAGGATITDPIATIQAELAGGYNGGAWNGPGIISSAVAALNKTSSLKYAVGYIDGATPPVNFAGGPSSGMIEILPTLAGDATLSGSVSFYDFQVVLSNFGKSNQSWDQGSFDYTGTVDFFDFQVVLSNFGKSSNALSSTELATLNQFAAESGEQVAVNPGGGLSLVSVPEPASIGLLGVAGVGMLARRRKTRQT